jgi:hypothetical protein
MAATFNLGEVVQLVGILSSPSLNGAVGTVVGNTDYESRGRYAVTLQSPAAAVASHPSGLSLSSTNLIRIVECAKPGCEQKGFKACSACRREYYCTSECQKKDWKTHKIVCNMIKRMPDTLLPSFNDVLSVIQEVLGQTEAQIFKLGRKGYIRLLQHTATFAEHQFGKRIIGKTAYERDNGDSIDNFTVDLGVFFEVYKEIVDQMLLNDAGNNTKGCSAKTLPYLQKTLAVLEPWRIQISLSEEERIDILSEETIQRLYDMLSVTEGYLIDSYRSLHDWNKTEHYCRQAVEHTKKLKGVEDRLRRVFDILTNLADAYCLSDRLPQAKEIREEAYIYVSEVYNPEHPLVLQAAGKLIETLTAVGDFYDAERFARICYEGLTRPPLDPESYEAAEAASNLAFASHDLIKAYGPDGADIEEAEMLAKKSVRIIKKLKG